MIAACVQRVFFEIYGSTISSNYPTCSSMRPPNFCNENNFTKPCFIFLVSRLGFFRILLVYNRNPKKCVWIFRTYYITRVLLFFFYSRRQIILLIWRTFRHKGRNNTKHAILLAGKRVFLGIHIYCYFIRLEYQSHTGYKYLRWILILFG